MHFGGVQQICGRFQAVRLRRNMYCIDYGRAESIYTRQRDEGARPCEA
jgi:hypothetical protein